MNLERVGVVGVGEVGRALATRLLEMGFTVLVYDARADAVAAAVQLGGYAATIPADVAEAVDVVILAVDDDAAAEEVLFDFGGIGETLCAGGYVLDASTTSVGFRDRATERLARFGITRIDVGSWLTAGTQRLVA